MREYLRDNAGRLIGWCESGPWGRTNGRYSSGYFVGWYDASRNETRDANGRLIGRGDLLARLF
jgi:hypothetical protein